MGLSPMHPFTAGMQAPAPPTSHDVADHEAEAEGDEGQGDPALGGKVAEGGLQVQLGPL